MFVRLAQLVSVAVFVLGPVLSRACADCACVEVTPHTSGETCACCPAEPTVATLAHGQASCCATGVECPACWWCAARGTTAANVVPAARSAAMECGHAPVHDEVALAGAAFVPSLDRGVDRRTPDLWGSVLPLLV